MKSIFKEYSNLFENEYNLFPILAKDNLQQIKEGLLEIKMENSELKNFLKKQAFCVKIGSKIFSSNEIYLRTIR